MGFRVTDTQRVTTMTQAGNTTTYYRVWLVTDRGSSGVVDIPADQWTEKALPDILKAEASKLDLAFTIKG
jgi:hypothetical protein